MANPATRKPSTDARLVITLHIRLPDVKYPKHAVDVLREFMETVDPQDVEELKKDINRLVGLCEAGEDIIQDISVEVAK